MCISSPGGETVFSSSGVSRAISAGPSSRSKVYPIFIKAKDSDAAQYPSLFFPIMRGVRPTLSLAAYKPSGVRTSMVMEPSIFS